MSTTTTDPRDVIATAREIAAELRNRVGIEYSPQGDPYEVVDDFEQDTASTLESLAARAEAAESANAELRAALEKTEKTIRACQWFWPDDDTSSEAGCDSAQEVVENAYGWCTPNGEVIAVARGGVVETTYCAALPTAEDADSDDQFWVEEQTEEAAEAAIKAELDRRALLRKGGADV